MPEVYWRLLCTAFCHFHSEEGRWNFNELCEVAWKPWKWIFCYSGSITNNSSVFQLNVAKTVNIVLSIYSLDFFFKHKMDCRLEVMWKALLCKLMLRYSELWGLLDSTLQLSNRWSPQVTSKWIVLCVLKLKQANQGV